MTKAHKNLFTVLNVLDKLRDVFFGTNLVKHAKHSLINVMGCVTLLSSQWYSHRVLEAMGKCCGHDHGHSHSHDH